MNDPVSPRSQFEELRAIAQSHLGTVELMCVSSVQEWCAERGIIERSPFRCGAVYRERASGRYTIVLADPITSDMRSNVITAKRMKGTSSEGQLAYLEDSANFVKQLLLHEVAHALDGERTEQQCDDWAFAQLGLANAA